MDSADEDATQSQEGETKERRMRESWKRAQHERDRRSKLFAVWESSTR
jgi:hypothetical protein